MRALGYIRVSTAEQAASGHSLQAQAERIHAWCVAKGLVLVDLVTDEGVSAGKPLERRRGGAVLLQRMAAGDADVVVVVSIDRIFRDAQDGLNTLLGTAGKPGMALQSVTDPCDTTTAMGRFILTVWLARAQLEREQTCERNLAIATSLRAQGRPNGYTPYGCVCIDGRLYRCPDTWHHREDIARMRLVEGLTFEAIAVELGRRGVASPAGMATWGRRSVARVVDTHDGLKHLPDAPARQETQVSAPQEGASA